MARTPQNLEEAKQIFREEKAKVTSSIAAIAGSRWLMAILATLAIAFGTHLLFAPTRLPTLQINSVAALGLPPVDFGLVGEQVAQAWASFMQSDGASQISTRFVEESNANADLTPTLNAVFFGAALVLLIVNMWIMTLRRRFSRG